MILDTWYLIIYIWCLMLDTWFLIFVIWYLISDTQSLILYQIINSFTWYLILDILCFICYAWYRILENDTWYVILVSDTLFYLISSIQYWRLDIWCALNNIFFKFKEQERVEKVAKQLVEVMQAHPDHNLVEHSERLGRFKVKLTDLSKWMKYHSNSE